MLMMLTPALATTLFITLRTETMPPMPPQSGPMPVYARHDSRHVTRAEPRFNRTFRRGFDAACRFCTRFRLFLGASLTVYVATPSARNAIAISRRLVFIIGECEPLWLPMLQPGEGYAMATMPQGLRHLCSTDIDAGDADKPGCASSQAFRLRYFRPQQPPRAAQTVGAARRPVMARGLAVYGHLMLFI